MNFFEIDFPNKEIKIYTQILKEFFARDKGISDILFTITKEQWNIIEDKLINSKVNTYLDSLVFTHSINTTKNSIELVFDAEIGMISEN